MINSNKVDVNKEESMEEMNKKATGKGFDFPYLADKNQVASKSFQATKTPEVFVLKRVNLGYAVIYHGAIDDNPQVEKDVRVNYLREAILAGINNAELAVKDTRVTGCMIK